MRMRILAIDHGEARAGCAICDPTETVVRPLTVVEPPAPQAFAGLVADEQADLVVVGVPVSLDGREGEQAAVVRRFREALAEVLTVPVETYDERLTTRLAERSRQAGATAAQDSLAAAHLLESYLAHRQAGTDARGPGP
jgi:putative Holliday junction resolvase